MFYFPLISLACFGGFFNGESIRGAFARGEKRERERERESAREREKKKLNVFFVFCFLVFFVSLQL